MQTPVCSSRSSRTTDTHTRELTNMWRDMQEKRPQARFQIFAYFCCLKASLRNRKGGFLGNTGWKNYKLRLWCGMVVQRADSYDTGAVNSKFCASQKKQLMGKATGSYLMKATSVVRIQSPVCGFCQARNQVCHAVPTCAKECGSSSMVTRIACIVDRCS